MAASSSAGSQALAPPRESTLSRLYTEGVIAGGIGAASVAIWFLLIDLLHGRPLFTPTVLGTALFRGKEGLGALDSLPASFEMVVAFTWVHALVFIIIGGVASRLLGLAEANPNLGFGLLLFSVFFLFGFLVVAMLFAEPVLHALTLPAILLGNLLAGGAMGVYFWSRHPGLTILP